MASTREDLGRQGKTPVFFLKDNSVIGIIALADTIKESSAQTIEELNNLGVEAVLLTGDKRLTAELGQKPALIKFMPKCCQRIKLRW